jgi:hypothetical protein
LAPANKNLAQRSRAWPAVLEYITAGGRNDRRRFQSLPASAALT